MSSSGSSAPGTTRNVTERLGVPIANEDHDFPRPAPGYGIGGWYDDDQAVLIYDKYDIWVIPTESGDPWNLTAGRGRQEKRIFRIIDTDPDEIAARIWDCNDDPGIPTYVLFQPFCGAPGCPVTPV